MHAPDDRHEHDDFAEVARLVQRYGPQATPLQLDRIKREAMLRASREHPRKGPLMRSKIATVLLAGGIALGVTGGVMAWGGGSTGGSAAKSQYLPGKGCGDTRKHTGPPGNPQNTHCPPQAHLHKYSARAALDHRNRGPCRVRPFTGLVVP